MDNHLRSSILVGSFACLFIVGCGGGAGVDTTVAGTSHTLNTGNMAVSYDGQTVTPQVSVTSLSAVVTTLAGANFTNLTFVPLPSIGQTQLAFDNQGQVWISGPTGSSPSDRTHFPNPWDITRPSSSPTFSQDGRIAFSQYDPTTKHYQIYVMPRVASNYTFTKLSDGTGDDLNPTWSPDNTRIAFQRSTSAAPKSQIYVMNNNGTLVKKIDDGTTDDTNPSWSPTSAKIVFQRHIVASGRYRLYTENADGTSILPLGSTILPTSDTLEPNWSPDGTQIAFVLRTGLNPTAIYSMDPSGTTYKQLSFDNLSDSSPSFSPDGQKMVYVKTTAAPFTALVVANADGSQPQTVVDLGSSLATPSWSPFNLKRTFVGTGGVFGTTASGFLFGQTDTTYSSLLTFTAKTPTSASVTPQTPSGQGNTALVFLIKADLITGIQYSTAYYAPPTNAIPGQTGTDTQALVTFDLNGVLRFIIPALQKGAAKAPALRPQATGGHLVYQGNFSGIWDSHGKNLAPAGASKVEIDPRTGDLVHFSK